MLSGIQWWVEREDLDAEVGAEAGKKKSLADTSRVANCWARVQAAQGEADQCLPVSHVARVTRGERCCQDPAGRHVLRSGRRLLMDIAWAMPQDFNRRLGRSAGVRICV